MSENGIWSSYTVPLNPPAKLRGPVSLPFETVGLAVIGGTRNCRTTYVLIDQHSLKVVIGCEADAGFHGIAGDEGSATSVESTDASCPVYVLSDCDRADSLVK
jgi:hypothetical protein